MSEKQMPEQEAAETVDNTETVDTAETTETTATEPAEKSKKKHKGKDGKAYEALQAQYDELNDSFLRMAAEYDNFRKRSTRERESTYADAVASAVKALLPVYDNLERALAQPTEDAAYKKGVELTQTQLLDALKSLNVTPTEDAPGTVFDPNLHNAVMHIDDEELGENIIAETFQRGFMIGDKVIRHSMVKVAN